MNATQAWTESHPGLDPNVSYPGIDHVDALNRIAGGIATLVEERDLYRGKRPEATFTNEEREQLVQVSVLLLKIADRKYQVMVHDTETGNISPGIWTGGA